MHHLVFVHGAGGGSWQWDSWMPVLSEKMSSTSVDYIAMDLVPLSSTLENTSFKDYETQVINNVQQKIESNAWKEGDNITLIGASMGGLICQRVAFVFQSSQTIGALVLICSAVPLEILQPQQTRYPSIMEWGTQDYEETVRFLHDGDETSWQFAHSHWKNESGKVMNEMFVDGIPISSSSLLSSKFLPIAVPTLVVIPEADETITPDTQQLLCDSIQNAVSFRYPAMTHCGPLLTKQATKVASDVFQWLQQTIIK